MAFGLVAIILIVTALASGAVERSPLTFPLLFLGLGFLLGERGVGLIQMGPYSTVLEVVVTLTLSLVLFLDAVNLQVHELGKRRISAPRSTAELLVSPCSKSLGRDGLVVKQQFRVDMAMFPELVYGLPCR